MTLEEILLQIEKPARYVGAEYNLPNMDKPYSARVCLCFPEIYEIGMSNIGVRILYHMLNDTDNVVCERCYAPDHLMGELLKTHNHELFSVDTRRPLKSFDIVGFSIGYEMLYTNVLYMMDLAKIPYYASARTESDPIIIAGGPCVVNPEPFADFFDAILIGEGEINLASFVDLYKTAKANGVSKYDFLDMAKSLEGVYIPNRNFNASTDVVIKSVVKDFDQSYFPTKILVPNIEITHDRAVLELYRGCANGCRFCQAGFYYRPIRHRSKATLVQQGKEIIQHTGYDELSLASLSTGDYPDLFDLITELKETVCNKRVKLAMPSLRLDTYRAEYMASGRLGSLTFAPEAGTDRLRRVINKNITEQNIIDTISNAISMGYNSVKLYFMQGLPTETMKDIEGIVEIVRLIQKMSSESGRKKPFNITVSTSIFIPKPITPFQWEKQISVTEMEERQQYLRDNLRMKNVRYNWHDPLTSVIEAVLARGDRKIAAVLVRAYELGAKFDGWSEHFHYDTWAKAFDDCGIDMSAYTREWQESEVLPWDFIDNGVTKSYLLKERHIAYCETSTPACDKDNCVGCGAAKLGRCYS